MAKKTGRYWQGETERTRPPNRQEDGALKEWKEPWPGVMQYEAESRKAESSLTGLGATGHRLHLGSYRGGSSAAQGPTGTWLGFQAPNCTTWTFHPCPLGSPSPSRTCSSLLIFLSLHRLNGHEFEQTPGDREAQGSPACCSLWGHRVRHDLVTRKQPPHQPLLDPLSTCFFLLYRVFLAVHRLSLVAASRGSSSLRCVGSSLWWLLAAQQRLQAHERQELQHRVQ